MVGDFIQIRSLQGELKISHKMRQLGVTVSTEEIVIQKPHINYHIPLDQIISITPYDRMIRDYSYVNRKDDQEEVTRIDGGGSKYYKIYTGRSIMHNRSGISEMGKMQFVLPLHADLLAIITRVSNLVSIC